MLLQGTNSYFILGNDQADWETRSTTAIQKVFNFISEEVVPGFEVYRFERNKGFSGPTKAIPGISGVSGPLRMHLADTHLGTILKWITGDNSLTTTTVAGGVMIAASTAVTVDTAQSPASGKQPKDLVAAPVEQGKIKVTLTGATGAGSIEIKGIDQLKRDITEIVSFSTPTNHTSTKHFRKSRQSRSRALLETPLHGKLTWCRRVLSMC